MIEPLTEKPRLVLTWKGVPFVLVHLGCLAAFWLPFSWSLVGLAAGLYLVRMFAMTGFYLDASVNIDL